MADVYKIKVKICLVGDGGVGKTSLIRRYVMDIYNDEYISTLGTKVSKKRLIIKKHDRDLDLTFSIWDVLGQEDFKNIQAMAFKGSKGAIMVCDITRKETLENLEKWRVRVEEVTGKIPMIILANKSDLTDQHLFTETELKDFSSKFEIDSYLTSAKYGDNVIKSFYKIGEVITNQLIK